jgi:dCTP deaminase
MRATSVLSDGTIRRLIADGHVRIEPFDETMVQPASIDLRLGRSFRVFHNHRIGAIDLADPPKNLTEHVEIDDGESSLGRLGLIVHATAGFVDPGFKGTLTLEITNLTRVPIILWPGKPIAQLSFMALDRPAERPYGHPDLGSHYHGQVEATESRYEGGPARR